MKILFKNLQEVAAADENVNERVNRKFKSEVHAEIRSEEQKKQKQKNDANTLDRKLIVDGVRHSMKKFDYIETYTEDKESGLQKYTNLLIDEVRRHYFEEKKIEDNLGENDPVLEFIKETVTKIVRRTLESKIN